MTKNTYRFRALDAKYGLIVDKSTINQILKLCSASKQKETGGILVGYYTEKHDWAIVSDCSGPPADSIQEYSRFTRGVKGLQYWLNQLWRAKCYYIGEWHFHPFASSKLSPIDLKQLKEHSENEELKCPEPIMLIIGGNPDEAWEVSAYIYPKGEGIIDMMQDDGADC